MYSCGRQATKARSVAGYGFSREGQIQEARRWAGLCYFLMATMALLGLVPPTILVEFVFVSAGHYWRLIVIWLLG